MSSLIASDTQQAALTQNALKPAFKQVDAAIKAAAQIGNFTVGVTLVGATDLALAPNIVEDLKLRGFAASFSTPVITATWTLA